MKKSLFILVIIVSTFLSSCSIKPVAIGNELDETQRAKPFEGASPTQTATLTSTSTEMVLPTLTPIPLSDIDLEEILIIANDLPAGYSGGQAHEVTSEQFNWVLYKGINNLYQEIAKDNAQVGGVTVFIYENANDALKAYHELVDALGDTYEELEDVGDEGVYYTLDTNVSGISVKNTSIVFRRCYATVNLGVSGSTDLMGISAYAKRLDERLQPLVCP